MKDTETKAKPAGSGGALRDCWTAFRDWLVPERPDRSASADKAHTTDGPGQSHQKHANLYLRQDLFIVAASSETTVGVWIETAPYFKLTTSASDEELGTAILSALQGSKRDVPHPTDWKNLQKPVYDFAGVRSWRSFVKGTTFVTLSDQSGCIAMASYIPLGTRGDFDPQNEMSVDAPSAQKAGESVRLLLAGQQANAPS